LEGVVAFDAIVVDEAAYSLEPSLLIPLKYMGPIDHSSSHTNSTNNNKKKKSGGAGGVHGSSSRSSSHQNQSVFKGARSLVLVGDPAQLSPSLNNSVPLLTSCGFGKSLMERFHAHYIKGGSNLLAFPSSSSSSSSSSSASSSTSNSSPSSSSATKMVYSSSSSDEEEEELVPLSSDGSFKTSYGPVIMLEEQYRMHSEICKFPSRRFYGESILCMGNFLLFLL
jgi:superfamily I DNA and/or RNA helicase